MSPRHVQILQWAREGNTERLLTSFRNQVLPSSESWALLVCMCWMEVDMYALEISIHSKTHLCLFETQKQKRDRNFLEQMFKYYARA